MTAAEQQTAPWHARQSPILWLCAAFLVIRLIFIFTVPFQDAPDEFCHNWMIAFMRDHVRLPSATEVAAGGVTSDYGSLPPLGYAPHVLLGWLMPGANLLVVERFGSLLAGVVLTIASYLVGREIFPSNKLCAYALPILILFHPQLAFIQSYANNDSTSASLCAVILLLSVRSIRRGLDVRNCALIGCLVGWTLLSKYSSLAVVPAAVLLLAAAGFLHKTPARIFLISTATCALCAIAVSSWWFVRNAHEYPGDMLGTKTIARTYAAFHHVDTQTWLEIIGQKSWWRFLYFSFWGLFSYMTKYMWHPIYFIYIGFLIAAAFGCVRVLLKRPWQRWKDSDDSGKQDFAMWTSFVLAVILNIVSVVWTSASGVSGPQGRYLFGSEIPLLALFLAGLFTLNKRWGKPLVLAFVSFNAVVCVGVLIWFIRLYGFHWSPN